MFPLQMLSKNLNRFQLVRLSSSYVEALKTTMWRLILAKNQKHPRTSQEPDLEKADLEELVEEDLEIIRTMTDSVADIVVVETFEC